jgi:hypothetical protein
MLKTRASVYGKDKIQTSIDFDAGGITSKPEHLYLVRWT